MIKIIPLFLLLLLDIHAYTQKSLKVINLKETKRIETALSANEMEGRRAFTSGNEKAATFIAKEFEKIGLTKWINQESYLQTFPMVKKSKCK